ncbi:MAG: pyrimidine dimer DNA glycosylase/endonuclease V [Chroococcales cyanobacterium]
MNIFVVDPDPKVAARSLCDKHIVKMPVESAQILCSVAHRHGYSHAPYRPFSVKHPCVIWAGNTRGNWEWMVTHALTLCEEYTRRYGKRHKSQDVIEWVKEHSAGPETGELEPFVMAMPEECKGKNPIEAYRRYYLDYKLPFATWKPPSEPPKWFTDNVSRLNAPQVTQEVA